VVQGERSYMCEESISQVGEKMRVRIRMWALQSQVDDK
jgi:hypothetical protein